jgi:hypothetical protein
MSDSPPAVPRHLDAFADVCLCFGRHCQGDLTEDGRNYLIRLFDNHVEAGLNSSGGPSWEDSRKHVLRWTAGIAQAAELDRKGGAVTEEVLRKVSPPLIAQWSTTCLNTFETYGPFCPATRGIVAD